MSSTKPSFNIILRLSNNRISRIKCQHVETKVSNVKSQLELLEGLPSETVRLSTVDGHAIDDEATLRLGKNVRDNEVLKVEITSENLAAFYMAISTGEVSEDRSRIFKEILERIWPGPQPLERDEKHDLIIPSLFHVVFSAAFHGNTDICDIALSKGVSVDQATALGNTSLHAAVARDKVSTALYLQARGSSLERENAEGHTIFDVARIFGAFTCTNKLRSAQRAKRKEEAFKMANNTEEISTPHIKRHVVKTTPQPKPESEPDGKSTEYSEEYNKHLYERLLDEHYEKSNIEGKKRDTQESREGKQGSKQGEPRCQTAKSGTKKVNRTQSAPLMRGPRWKRKDVMQEEGAKKLQHNFLRMSRPQYIQYIKSSTGVVEEDYFADIFPQNHTVKPKRDFSSQMQRNEKIFRKMMRQLPGSSTLDSDSNSDSEDERHRFQANDQAYRRWKKKKQSDRDVKSEERAFQPSLPRNTKEQSQCVGPVLMIGDTSKGDIKSQEVNEYINAYQKTRRIKSAASAIKHRHPLTYEEWVISKPEPLPPQSAETPIKTRKPELARKIDYKTWLVKANERLELQAKTKVEEETRRREFNQWIKEVKDDAGIFQYWTRQKEQQAQRQLKEQKRLREVEKRKQQEKAQRAEFSREVYQDWLLRHEMERIKLEEQQLQRERERLKQIKQTAKV